MSDTFTETQTFTAEAKRWMLGITAASLLLIGWTLSNPKIFHLPIHGSGPPVAFVVVILGGVFGFTIWMIRRIFLRTDVDGSELRIEFHPYKPRRIPLGSIARVEAVTFRALLDCGGRGMRWGYKGKGWSFTISGNEGVEVTTQEGKIFLIGTQRQAELLRVLKARVG